MLGLAALLVQPALAQELKTLGKPLQVEQTNAAPEIYDVKEGARQLRAFRQQPPLIPHRVEKYEIDMKVNQCLRCHDWPYYVEEKAPKISETHYVDREGTRLDRIAGTRWFCSQCHVPQVDARPLVENQFRAAAPSVR
ncbi:MAG: nitrate reductase cytochrome c-type subunit [Alphaproteobacteria bacterium]|nr:nitrate reductase cytochrome c-type subunit [Alphaproteobacteria bacterium]